MIVNIVRVKIKDRRLKKLIKMIKMIQWKVIKRLPEKAALTEA